VKQALAIDLGGTKTAVAYIDESGRIAEKQKIGAAKTFAGSMEQIAAHGTADIAAAGVIVPGIYDAATGTAWAPNLWGGEFYPIREALKKMLRVPVAIGSDRTGSVMAEQWVGAARGLENVVFVAVGTGIGVGIVLNGRPVEGAHGTAGAAGWMEAGVHRVWGLGERSRRSGASTARGNGIGGSGGGGGARGRPEGHRGVGGNRGLPGARGGRFDQHS